MNPTKEILDAIIKTLLLIWIAGGVYLTLTGVFFSVWLGLYGFLALASGLLTAYLVYLINRR